MATRKADRNGVGCLVLIVSVFVLVGVLYGIRQLTSPPPLTVAVSCHEVAEPDCHAAYEAGLRFVSGAVRELHVSAVVRPTIFHGYCSAGGTSLYDVSYLGIAGDVKVVMTIVRTDNGALTFCGL